MDKINDLLKEYPQYITVEDLDSLKVLRGFIKWLVDNDKIDRVKLGEIGMYGDLEQCRISMYNALLMLLAIQDEPIKFLISILK